MLCKQENLFFCFVLLFVSRVARRVFMYAFQMHFNNICFKKGWCTLLIPKEFENNYCDHSIFLSRRVTKSTKVLNPYVSVLFVTLKLLRKKWTESETQKRWRQFDSRPPNLKLLRSWDNAASEDTKNSVCFRFPLYISLTQHLSRALLGKVIMIRLLGPWSTLFSDPPIFSTSPSFWPILWGWLKLQNQGLGNKEIIPKLGLRFNCSLMVTKKLVFILHKYL